MAEQHPGYDNYGLDLTKRKDRAFYNLLSKNPKMKRLWLERHRSKAAR
jgi:hypothetical protein